MKKLMTGLLFVALTAGAGLGLPTGADGCCWGWKCCRGWSGCGWRGCGWNNCGWGNCGWGGCTWGASYGCTWGGYGWGPVCVAPGGFQTVAWGGPVVVPVSPTTTVVMNSLLDDPPLLISPPRYVIRPRVQSATPAAPGQQPAPQPPPPAEMLPAPVAEPMSSQVEVRVPVASAEVWFSGHKTKQSGLKRTFETPALQPGKVYSYDVVVKWTDENGRPVQDQYRLEVRAGRQAVVAFGQKPGDASSWVALRSMAKQAR